MHAVWTRCDIELIFTQNTPVLISNVVSVEEYKLFHVRIFILIHTGSLLVALSNFKTKTVEYDTDLYHFLSTEYLGRFFQIDPFPVWSKREKNQKYAICTIDKS